MFKEQEETGRELNNQMEYGGNLVNEGTNKLQPQNGSETSLDKYMEKFQTNPRISEKEKEFSQKVDNFIKSKTGKTFSSFTGYIFMANKILLLSTLTEFLFQRFDIITFYLNFVIIAIELGIFSNKHIYKWLIVLIGSILLDALVLLDISPVSKNVFI